MARLRPEAAKLFRLEGYVRLPNEERRTIERSRYKKGWEVRFVVGDEEAAEEVIAAAIDLNFAPGSPFRKGNRIVVPLSGLDAVDAFLVAHNVPLDDPRRAAVIRARRRQGSQGPRRFRDVTN